MTVIPFLLDEVYTGSDVVEAISVVWEYLQKEDPYRFTWVFNYPHFGRRVPAA